MTLQVLQRAVHTGDYHLARHSFLELLVEPEAPLPLVFCEISVAEYQQGNLRTALTFAEAGEKLLVNQPTPDPELLARLRKNLANFYREIGDYSKSISAGLKWLGEMGDNPTATYRRAQLFYNLALAYRERGGPHDNAEALRLYDQARSNFREVRLTSPAAEERERCRVFEVMSLQNEAWLLCEVGDIEQAQEYAGMAAKLLTGEHDVPHWEQVLLSAYLAFNTHNIARCQSLLSDLERLGHPTTARQQFWVEWLAARVALANGHGMLTEAHSTLAAAEAERSKEVYLIRLAAELEKEVMAAG